MFPVKSLFHTLKHDLFPVPLLLFWPWLPAEIEEACHIFESIRLASLLTAAVFFFKSPKFATTSGQNSPHVFNGWTTEGMIVMKLVLFRIVDECFFCSE